jgi:branched-subunit amino acid aminotransferase/4-amino-4-deoxychorismate lyase
MPLERMRMANVILRNGEIIPANQAKVSVLNIEYSYGFGVYETVRVTKGVPYFIAEHIARLLSSAALVDLAHAYSTERIAEYVNILIAATGMDTFNLKMLLIGASKVEDTQLFMLPLTPLFPDRKLYRDGARLTAVEQVRFCPHAKTLNMLPSYLSYREAKRRGCYDALLVDAGKHILEGTRTNFFLVRGHTLVSPPSERILEGITREALIKVARYEGFNITERDVTLDDLTAYDGAFLTSTSSKIIPIRSVDDFTFPDIPDRTRELMKAFDSFLASCNGRLR